MAMSSCQMLFPITILKEPFISRVTHPSPLQLVRYGFSSYRASFLPALRKIESLDRNAVSEAIHRVPGEWMSCSERRFAVEMMTYGHAQLQELYR